MLLLVVLIVSIYQRCGCNWDGPKYGNSLSRSLWGADSVRRRLPIRKGSKRLIRDIVDKRPPSCGQESVAIINARGKSPSVGLTTEVF
jgi:hypothetical protein